MKTFYVFALAALVSSSAFALEAPAMPAENIRSMNSIAFDDYKGFWNTWKPITTRYRVDNNEMRVTYANDVAQKAIEQGLTRFPDGAAFGKIAWSVAPDPLFPNSLQPRNIHRIQLMVMDQKKYPDERGWGYAIFYSNGTRLPGVVKELVAACAACHEHAEARGYAFVGSMDPNQPTLIHEHLKNQTAQPKLFGEFDVEALARATGAIDSKITPRSEIPPQVLRRLPQGTAQVARIGQSMAKHAFLGTANELSPLALNAAHATNLPAAFWSDDSRTISVAYRDPLAYECKLQGGKGAGTNYVVVISSTGSDAAGAENTITSEKKVCR